MKTSRIILWVLALGLVTSCEKFELNEHCPKDDPSVDAQQARATVNDDSDQEDGVSRAMDGTLDASGDPLIEQSSTSGGNTGEGDDTSDDDFVNDDSDNEEEATTAKQPSGSSGSGNGPKSGRP